MKSATGGKSRGVYCLANDRVLEWFRMFLHSYRRFNPALPLAVIPYNAETAEIQKLAAQFDFQILPEAAVAPFDALETSVMNMGRHAGMFRKWAAFFGGYDEFLFFDADIAVAMPLDGIFAALEKSGRDFLYFDTDITMVYRPEHIPAMREKYQSAGFNAGAFGARKGAVTREQLWQMADRAAADRRLFEPLQVDQPFLNYVCDTLPLKKTPLSALLPEMSPKPWARVPFRLDRRTDTLTDAAGLRLPFMHWAGCGWPTMVRPEIFLHYRTLGLPPAARLACRARFYAVRWKRQAGNFLRRHGWKK